jgi:hypothetical protein
MNKAEELNLTELLEDVWFSRKTVREASILIRDWREQYAQQRERETAVDFELRHLLKTDAARRITYKYFDDWYANHQNQQ